MQRRPTLEVADIFRAHGSAWRHAQRGHLSLAKLKVMSAITRCRTAAPGGHWLRYDGCGLIRSPTQTPTIENGAVYLPEQASRKIDYMAEINSFPD